jgi:hypothetical protein
MATDNKPASPAKEPKTYVAFFTREEAKGPKVEIFKNLSDKARAPLFDGKIDDVHVSMFLRKGPKGQFLGLVGDKKEGDERSPDLGTANIVTTTSGSPRLAINMKNADGTKAEVIFASISKKVDNEMLVKIGLNEAKQIEKRATAAAKAAAAPAAAKKSSPKP